ELEVHEANALDDLASLGPLEIGVLEVGRVVEGPQKVRHHARVEALALEADLVAPGVDLRQPESIRDAPRDLVEHADRAVACTLEAGDHVELVLQVLLARLELPDELLLRLVAFDVRFELRDRDLR